MSSNPEDELRGVFLEEATQLLADAEQCFLLLETSPEDLSLIEKIFRLAHNLKGSANAVGFSTLGELTHVLESYLLKIKSGEIKVQKSSVSLLLRCNDEIVQMVDQLKEDPSRRLERSPLIEEIQLHISGKYAEDTSAGTDSEEASDSMVEPVEEDRHPMPSMNDSGFVEFAEEQPAMTPVTTIKEVAAPVATVVSETQGGETKKAAPAAHAIDESIRVSLGRVDRLINLVGEMVILQTVLNEQVHHDNSILMRKTVHQLGKVTKEVQDIAMGLRMVPIKPTFQKMQRIVRDTSSALGKDVQLILNGEDTELDKTILEKIGDPLVHLVRNAVDHGIESTEKRVAHGKPPTGKVYLNASHQADSLVIEVRDDGAGLDPQVLKNNAIERGILKPGTAISDQEAFQLIFASGFSTKSQVTDISGRGVGMDVVRTNVEQLQGDIHLDSVVGKGTSIKIKLPLTLAIIDGMTVRCGNERYIIPLSHVFESTRLLKSDIHTMAEVDEVFVLRGENLPLYHLSTLLGKTSKGEQESIAMIVRASGDSFAVAVDDIISQSQIVIKNLGSEHKNLRGISGSAILGDGRAALILELPELVSRIKRSNNGTTATRRNAA